MRIEPRHTVIIGMLGCFILAILCAKTHIPAIEQDLILRTKSALASETIQQLEVFANGRDVILTGVAADEDALSRALAKARNVPGVFRVKSRLRLREAAPAPSP